MQPTVYDVAKTLASKCYYKYRNEFKNDSISLEDLIQEANLKVIEIKNKYPEKNDIELIKLSYRAIVWKLASLRRNALQCSHKFVHKKEFVNEQEENFSFEDDFDIKIYLTNNKFNFEEVMTVLNQKEYDVVKSIFKNKTDYETLASQMNISKRQVARLYKQALRKIKDFFLLDK